MFNRPLPDQLDIIHVECGMHMEIIDVDPVNGNFLCGCRNCKLQLIVQRFVPQAPEKTGVESTPNVESTPDVESTPERITAASDPKTDYVPKKHLRAVQIRAEEKNC